jgi:hypothetical protein
MTAAIAGCWCGLPWDDIGRTGWMCGNGHFKPRDQATNGNHAAESETVIPSLIDHLRTERQYPQSDSGQAEFIADLYGEDMKYDHRRSRTLLFQSPRWQEDPTPPTGRDYAP